MKTIHILIGLPGSGKTYFAKDYCDKTTNHCIRFDIDYILLTNNSLSKTKSAFDIVVDTLCSETVYSRHKFNNSDCMVDGLFTKSNDITKIIEAINEVIICNKPKKSPKLNTEIILHYWNEDREHCLENDKFRFERPTSSKISIENLNYIDLNNKEVANDLIEKIKKLEIKDIIEIKNIKIKKHEVYKMDNITKKIKKLISGLKNPYIDNNNILKSASWCTGGAYGSCWDDNLSPVSGEEPQEFDEFDEIMGNLVPDVSFIKYKNIKNKCVKLEKTYEHDYYGGGCGYEYWTCDLNKLIELCEEYGYSIKNN